MKFEGKPEIKKENIDTEELAAKIEKANKKLKNANDLKKRKGLFGF